MASWWELAIAAWNAYEQNKDRDEDRDNSRNPKVTRPPMDPAQIALMQQTLNYAQPGGNPYMNYLGPMIQNQLQGYGQNLSWDAPKTLDVPGVRGQGAMQGGQTGYRGTPAWGGNIDWTKLFQPWVAQTGTGATPPKPVQTPPQGGGGTGGGGVGPWHGDPKMRTMNPDNVGLGLAKRYRRDAMNEDFAQAQGGGLQNRNGWGSPMRDDYWFNQDFTYQQPGSAQNPAPADANGNGQIDPDELAGASNQAAADAWWQQAQQNPGALGGFRDWIAANQYWLGPTGEAAMGAFTGNPAAAAVGAAHAVWNIYQHYRNRGR